MTSNYLDAVQRVQRVCQPGEYLPGLQYAIEMACLDIEIQKANDVALELPTSLTPKEKGL